VEDIREMTVHVETPVINAESLQQAIELARERKRPVVITGSVYLVGAALEYLQESR